MRVTTNMKRKNKAILQKDNAFKSFPRPFIIRPGREIFSSAPASI